MRARLAALVVGLALVLAACSGSTEPTVTPVETSAPSISVEETTTSTLPCGDPVLPAGYSYTATAAQEGELAVYETPDAAEPSWTLGNPRFINNDPNAAVPLLFLVEDTPDDDCDWIEVLLPVRPNGTSGYVKRADVTLAQNPYSIEVDLAAFRLVVRNGEEVVMDTTIATAADNTPTPGGKYFTTELVQTPNPGGAYGPYAYGLSGFSDVLQTFNGGPGQLGIHGTNQPQLLGQQVSHGCIRLSNDDITTLAEMLPLGVPVTVNA